MTNIRILSPSTVTAMKFLGRQGAYDDTVLEFPAKHVPADPYFVKQWYDHESGLMVMAFADKRGYLNNEDIEFPGIIFGPRIGFLTQLIAFEMQFNAIPSNAVMKKLKENNITFIYSTYPLVQFEKIKGIQKIFQNTEATIYKVNEI